MLRFSWSLPFSFPVRVMLTVVTAITLTAPAAEAQVRITEVLADPAGADAGNQKVEITNLGDTLADIGGWRICVQFVYRTFPSPLSLDPGESYVVHVRSDGAGDDNNFFTGSAFPALAASDDSFGLYLPSGGFGSSSAIADYVGWGAGGQPRESVAVGAGIWGAGDFVPLPTEGQSIQLCDKDAHSSADWLAGEVSIGGSNLACNTVSVPGGGALVTRIGRPAPNPTLGATTLSFELSAPARVQAVVIDARGRLVADLGERLYAAGSASLVWSGRGSNGRRLGPGNYWIRLRSSGLQAPGGGLWSAAARVVRLGSGG